MMQSSGIGTYLRQLLPRVVQLNPDLAFELIGAAELADLGWGSDSRVAITESHASLYTIREQLEVVARSNRQADLFWSPHYNIPLLRRGRLLVTVHDLAHLALPELVRGVHRRAYARMMFQAVSRAAVRIFDSRFTAREYERLVGPMRKDDRVIYPGVDRSWFEVVRSPPPHPRPYLLFVGNVKPHKNLRVLLRMMAGMKDILEHDLVIVGRKEGFIHGDAEVLEHAAPLGDRVLFTGWIDEDRLKQYFKHAAALVFPSYYEGFGLPPLEAMACGCPVVVSRAASLPEVCGDAALYFEPSSPDALGRQVRTLLTDEVLRSELVERGRERASAFTWDRCATETSEVLRSAMVR